MAEHSVGLDESSILSALLVRDGVLNSLGGVSVKSPQELILQVSPLFYFLFYLHSTQLSWLGAIFNYKTNKEKGRW